MQALIAGATGLVGRTLLDALLAEARVERVTAVLRRPSGRTHAKLEELSIDFDELERDLSGRNATHAFCCLGTTIKKAGSQPAFYRIDHDYVLAFGRAAKAAGARKLLVVTALGADAKSSVFYNRVKGEVEAHLGELGLPELHLLRPSLLLGERAERRTAEGVAMALAKPLGHLLIGPLARYRPVEGSDVALAMLALALETTPRPGVSIHESEAIPQLASSVADPRSQ